MIILSMLFKGRIKINAKNPHCLKRKKPDSAVHHSAKEWPPCTRNCIPGSSIPPKEQNQEGSLCPRIQFRGTGENLLLENNARR
jgi:hypothetical protein